MKPLYLFISLLLVICFIQNADGSDPAPPKCIGEVCLFQHIDEVETKIYGYGKEIFGPIAFLKDEGRYESAGATMETMNWVMLTICRAPGTIKAIHRVMKDVNADEFGRLINNYESGYGTAGHPAYTPQHQKTAQWTWEDPLIELIITRDSRLNIISIDLEAKDFDNSGCLEQAKIN